MYTTYCYKTIKNNLCEDDSKTEKYTYEELLIEKITCHLL